MVLVRQKPGLALQGEALRRVGAGLAHQHPPAVALVQGAASKVT